MEILILGGTEFVSCALAKKLISKNYTVDIFTRGLKSITYKGIRNHFIGNRNNIKDIYNSLYNKEYDVIFDISGYFKEDVENIFKAISKNKLRHYIFCSTIAVYKKTKDVITEKAVCGENDEWDLSYASNKKKAEDYLRKLYKENTLPITIFRPTYIYGEGNNVYREAFIFDRIIYEKPIFITDNNTMVNFIHVNDLVNVFESSIHSKTCIGKTYNVANSQKVTWEILINNCANIVGKSTNIIKVKSEYLNYWKLCLRDIFPFYDTSYRISNNKLVNDGLFIPRIDIDEGLKNSYDWYINDNPKLYDKRLENIKLIEEDYSKI